ncbi:hypothetical protein [Pleionea sp. CnH1-48]|uniref:hypothetical protein n=1 Tax=Pleionea sp. CnH1-48 TaxID=2954494 RepID=UPI002097F6BD|nr:hypothetical protein [Pleionea sp. CnH1-48]MCO7224696.1 hypothetical protein [Pleionea sp. CnH1-48]
MSIKIIASLVVITFLTSCAETSALDVTRALLGYVEPPKAEPVLESLKKEYRRCMAENPERPCVQIAYDNIRDEHELDERALPKGYVRIIQGEVEKENTDAKESEQ